MNDENSALGLVEIVGDESPGGTYVLRLMVRQPVAVQFGRFRQGQLVEVPAGTYLYVGSAMRGLGARLLRHASRTDASQPQPIRSDLAMFLMSAGLVRGKRPYPPKRLHWHIDYLLEKPEVELTHVIVLRSSMRLETAVADMLAQDPATFIVTPGLGAQDDPGRTHLLGVHARESWWQALLPRLLLLNESVKLTHQKNG